MCLSLYDCLYNGRAVCLSECRAALMSAMFLNGWLDVSQPVSSCVSLCLSVSALVCVSSLCLSATVRACMHLYESVGACQCLYVSVWLSVSQSVYLSA